MKERYACLECGFIHNGKTIIRKRIDRETPANRCCCSSFFHGFITYRICPKCEHKQQIKVEED